MKYAMGALIAAAVLALAIGAAGPLAAQVGGVVRQGDSDRPADKPIKPDKGEGDKPGATPTTIPADAKDLVDEARFDKADIVLRVSTEGGKEWLPTYGKATFKVLDVYKEGKHEIGTGKLAKGGEFWMAYILRKTDKPLPAGEMTLYLVYKVEYMQAGMQRPRKSYSLEFLNNTPEKGFSHLKTTTTTSAPASGPATESAEN